MLPAWRGTWLMMTLLIAAMAGLVSHVCVVPLHAHAVPLDGHGSHDEDATDQSVHTASCEAAENGASGNRPAPPLSIVELLPTVSPEPASARATVARDVPTAVSPPLFLLHVSLLI